MQQDAPTLSVLALWLPILASAVVVFLASFVLHTLLKYHRSDIAPLPREDEFLGSLRSGAIAPGEYAAPYATMEEMNSPEFVRKRSAGPIALVTVLPGGPPTMTRNLIQWFLYALVVSLTSGYVAARAVGVGPIDYLDVFRFAGTTAFAGYALGTWQHSIWWGRPWKTTLKSTIDGLIYALLTAGIFGWLWPGGTS